MTLSAGMIDGRSLLHRLRDFVQEVHGFSDDEGVRPFNTIDYYGMEDLLKDIDAELKTEQEIADE